MYRSDLYKVIFFTPPYLRLLRTGAPFQSRPLSVHSFVAAERASHYYGVPPFWFYKWSNFKIHLQRLLSDFAIECDFLSLVSRKPPHFNHLSASGILIFPTG